MTVHMLNCTNTFMLRSAYREDIPVGTQLVTINIPDNRSVKDVRLLVAGTEANFSRIGSNTLIVIVPKVVDHEVVAVNFV